MFTRRRFLAGLIPSLAVLTGGFAVLGYRQGRCPLSAEGYCVGPCTAIRDGDGDLICDRIPLDETPGTGPTGTSLQVAPTRMPAATPAPTVRAPLQPQRPGQTSGRSSAVACPFGLVNDPYPGRCRRYVDRNGNGLCDLSEPQTSP